MPDQTESKRAVISVRQTTEYWIQDGQEQSSQELAIYTPGSVMQFALDDPRLPADIETNWANYLLCKRRFEPGKKRSRTGLTSVWFEEINYDKR